MVASLFPRTNNPLVSILTPTRGRCEHLVRSVDSLASLAKNLRNIEFVFKIDDDDKETIEIVNKIAKLLPYPPVIITSPRGNGYQDIHLWYNSMCNSSHGDWVLIWNDDSLMQTQFWDFILEHTIMDDRYWHGVQDICCLCPKINDDPMNNALFFLRRKVIELLGRLSAIPHCDTWTVQMMSSINSFFSISSINVVHLETKDTIFQEGDQARATTKYTTHNKGATLERLRDAIKLQEYIDANRKSKTSKKLDQNIIRKYKIIDDEDVRYFLNCFDENPESKILEVGSHDEPVANILSEHGHSVYGIDLREYDATTCDFPQGESRPLCNYNYIRADLCDLPAEFLKEHLGTFDVIVSLSAIEHFGLEAYSEGGGICPYYDVIAMRIIWSLLKEGGTCYISVPFGSTHLNVIPHWRVYNSQSVMERLVQDFTVIETYIFVAGQLELDEKTYNIGDAITVEQASSYSGNPPHISMLLKMIKNPTKRLSPDGR